MCKSLFSILLFSAFVALVAIQAQASTISEISMIAEGGHATSDEVVILSVTDLVPNPGMRSFQVRDATGAMTIYGINSEIAAALDGFSAGDMIEIGGYTSRLDGALVLITGGTIGGFAVSGRTSTNPLPFGAVTVFPSDIGQSYESNLVCLLDGTFDVSGGSGIFAAETSYSFNAKNSVHTTEQLYVRIATAELGLVGQPIPTGPVNITGIVIPDPAGDGYCLAPRGTGDIIAVPEPVSFLLLGLSAMLLGKTTRKL